MFGTNGDGSFTEDISMDEMIEVSINHIKGMFQNDPSFDEKETTKI